MATLQELHRQGASLLRRAEQPGLESKAFLKAAAGLSEIQYLLDTDRGVLPRVQNHFFKMIARRKSGVPLPYVTGWQEFWSLSLKIKPGVFIPRPETELLLELALERVTHPRPFILDLGTGSGNIAIALVDEIRGARVMATDISLKALDTARLNAQRQGWKRIDFVQATFFAGLVQHKDASRFDMIVSNPPYVSEKEWRRLSRTVRCFEPKKALVPGLTGLEAIRRIVRESPNWLKPAGWLILEIGAGQRKDVLALFDRRWRDVRCYKDLAGLDRAVTARLVSQPRVEGGECLSRIRRSGSPKDQR